MLQIGQRVENLEGHLQKPWPKLVLMRPEKWHILAYLGAGATATIAAGIVALRDNTQTVYVGAPVLAACAAIMYIRAAQFYNYFYGR